MEKNLRAIILAAGEGRRMKSEIPKVLHKILEKPLLFYVLDSAKKAGASERCVVVGHKAEQVEGSLAESGVRTALQAEQLGTGHAVMQAADFIHAEEDVFVLYGDTPLIREETLKEFLEFHRREQNGASIISALIDDPAGYGHIIRDGSGRFLKNVEHKDADEKERAVKEINTGVYLYKGAVLLDALYRLKNDNAQGEYYLPDTLSLILEMGETVGAMQAADVTEFFGVNSRVQLAEAAEIMKNRINRMHMENGVTLADPAQTYIGPDVEIGMDTILYPGVILEGKTKIGSGCLIGPASRLTDMEVGDEVKIQYSTALSSKIGNHTTVGPYAYIRPDCVIGDNIRIGDFVEVKNSVIKNGTKVSHLTYVGDSDVGERINFGCGTVTVNYDGRNKYRTVIKDDVFIGCNTNLVAPVTVEQGSYIAAGSTITKDVPEGELAVARSRQQNIKGWKRK